jgi:Cu/Ag efflux pump CusA
MQAVLRSWTLSALSLLGIPVAVLGSLAAAAIDDGHFSLGSLLGLAAVLALMVRQGIGLVAHFQYLQSNEVSLLAKGWCCAASRSNSRASSHRR